MWTKLNCPSSFEFKRNRIINWN